MPSPPFDAVVILGKQLKGDPDRALRELRARSAAASAAHRAGVPLVATLEARLKGQEASGSSLVQAMLAELGVPPPAILAVDRSRSTREEALVAAELLGERGIRRALVVTARYHTTRARGLFEETGLHVAVHAPDALWRVANPVERAWIEAGEPTEATLAAEARTEALWTALGSVIAPLPARWRQALEVRAGAALRGVDPR